MAKFGADLTVQFYREIKSEQGSIYADSIAEMGNSIIVTGTA